MRIDKWLWCARFFKTRTLAAQAVDNGRVHWQGERCKPAREIRVDDCLTIRTGETEWEIRVCGLSDKRGSAPIAQMLYQETPESLTKRQEQAILRKMSKEPAQEIKGRPTKRDRRVLGTWKGK